MKTHLVFAFMTLALLALVIGQGQRREFTFDTVAGIARELSDDAYAPRPPIPRALRELNYDQARDIRFREDHTLWRPLGLPFQVRFFYGAGAHNSEPITVFQVNRDGAGPVRFSAEQFDFGPLVKLTPAERATGDYSGFRVHYPLNKPDVLDEALVFQGASYFRPLARGLIYGISARGIAIDPLGRENFPSFTTFWLVEPAPGASEMKIYALLEGRDLTGAYEFRLHPGEQTRIHVRAALFPRVAIKEPGIAPLTSMYWYGENTSNTFGNWRPEVHDSDGLQLHLGSGEWVWRPLAWARQRQVNVFADENPKGFGLFQRDRDFNHYQDLEAQYHQRPSIWIQPDGDWGRGDVVLMQNPTADEYADNIVAWWRPAGGLRAGERRDFAYTLVTFGERPDLPPLARCISTRIDYQEKTNYRFFVLTFTGGELAGLPADTALQPDIWVGKEGILSNVQWQKIPGQDAGWLVSFGVTSKESGNPVEMRCALNRDGRPLTETWSYTWVK